MLIAGKICSGASRCEGPGSGGVQAHARRVLRLQATNRQWQCRLGYRAARQPEALHIIGQCQLRACTGQVAQLTFLHPSVLCTQMTMMQNRWS